MPLVTPSAPGVRALLCFALSVAEGDSYLLYSCADQADGAQVHRRQGAAQAARHQVCAQGAVSPLPFQLGLAVVVRCVPHNVPHNVPHSACCAVGVADSLRRFLVRILRCPSVARAVAAPADAAAAAAAIAALVSLLWPGPVCSCLCGSATARDRGLSDSEGDESDSGSGSEFDEDKPAFSGRSSSRSVGSGAGSGSGSSSMDTSADGGVAGGRDLLLKLVGMQSAVRCLVLLSCWRHHSS